VNGSAGQRDAQPPRQAPWHCHRLAADAGSSGTGAVIGLGSGIGFGVGVGVTMGAGIGSGTSRRSQPVSAVKPAAATARTATIRNWIGLAFMDLLLLLKIVEV